MEAAVVQVVRRDQWVEVKAGGSTRWEYLESMQRMKKRTTRTCSGRLTAPVCLNSVPILLNVESH